MPKICIKDKDKLVSIMASNGLNQSDLAKSVDVSRTYIGQIIKGVRNPSPKLALKIANKLNESFDSLFFTKSASKRTHKEDN